MDIGVPRERRASEYRVGLIPSGVQILCEEGHRVYVEQGAGIGSGFTDEDYRKAGATMVYSTEEAYVRADLVVKVARPTAEETTWLHANQIICGFLHLAAARRSRVQSLLDNKVTAIGYDTIQDDDGTLPVLLPISQITGRMCAQVAARLLENTSGGKGVLLGGVPGVPPAEVVILGAGVVGTNAARAFLGLGANVYVMDKNLRALDRTDTIFDGRVVTLVSHPFNIEKMVRFADVLVGAVQTAGMRSPILVTRELLRRMKPRSIVIDVSVSSGGCVETTRPTTHTSPTFVEEGIIHYCVPNMSGIVARTATHAFNNAAWPLIYNIARDGLDAALDQSPALARGVNVRNGQIIHPGLAAAFSVV